MGLTLCVGNDTPASPFHAGLSLPCWHQHSRTGDRDLLGVLPKCSSQSTALRVPTGTLEKNIWQQREERGVGGRTGWLSWAQGSFLVPISSPEMDPLAPSRDSCPCSAASAHLAAPSLLYPALGTILSLVVDFIQTGLHFPFFFFFPINSSVFRHASKIPQGFYTLGMYSLYPTAFPVQKLSTIAKRHGATDR